MARLLNPIEDPNATLNQLRDVQRRQQQEAVGEPIGGAQFAPQGSSSSADGIYSQESTDKINSEYNLAVVGRSGISIEDVRGALESSGLDYTTATSKELRTAMRFVADRDLSGGVSPLGDLEAHVAGLNSEAKDDLLEELGWQKQQADKNFGRQARDISESFGDRIGLVNAQVGDAKKDLKAGVSSYALFMDSIMPGFSDAVDKAEKAAKATAAIEATFSDAGEEIDAAYASASGRARAMADAVGGAGSEGVAKALNETVFEMKGFIDEQGELDRNQTIAMHGIAAQMAGAAAEAEHAKFRGEGARDTFALQAKYENILTNLVRQRSLLNTQRKRALRDLQERRDDYKTGFDRSKEKDLEDIDDQFSAEVFAANATQEQWLQSSGTFTIRRFNENPATAIPKSVEDNVYSVALVMHQEGLNDIGAFAASEWVAPRGTAADKLKGRFPVEMVEDFLRYEDQIEVMVKNFAEAMIVYDTELSGQPSSIFGQAASRFTLNTDLGMSQGNALRETESFLQNNALGVSRG